MYEECDLLEGISYDGCTDTCTVENNFVCLNNSCSYTGDFQIEYTYIKK